MRRWRPTLRQTIGVVLAAMILVTAIAVTTLTYLSTRNQLLGFSRELIAYNAEVVREHTKGAGVNVLLDVIGADYWERNLASMALRGRLVLVGTMGGGGIEADLRPLMFKRLRVTGTVLRSRPIEEKIAVTNQIKRHVLPLIASGAIKPVVDTVYPLAEAAEAHRLMESNANFGKIILAVD